MKNFGRGVFFILLILTSIISMTRVLTLETSRDKVQDIANASAVLRR